MAVRFWLDLSVHALGSVPPVSRGHSAILCDCVNILFKSTFVAHVCTLQVLICAASYPEASCMYPSLRGVGEATGVAREVEQLAEGGVVSDLF